MEIFNLPKECEIDKNIPKEIIYKNAEANEKLKRVFINNVEKIRFMYLLNFSNSFGPSYSTGTIRALSPLVNLPS